MLKFRRVLAMPSVPLDCSCDPSRTRQEFTADADINNIVRRFLRDGVLPQPNAGRPTISDGLAVPGDFQEACEASLDYQHAQQLVSNPDELHNDGVNQDGDNQQSTPPFAGDEEKKE